MGWFIIFGQIGILKYSKNSAIGFWYAIAGLAGLVFGSFYLYKHFPRNGENPSVSDDPYRDKTSVAANRPHVMSNVGFSVIFLGGFAYFCVLFFNFNDREFEFIYLHAMCLCFTTSMWVMVFCDAYSTRSSLILDLKSKKEFSSSTFYFYVTSIALAYGCVLALLVGLFVMGNIKFATDEMRREIEIIISVGTAFVLLISIPLR